MNFASLVASCVHSLSPKAKDLAKQTQDETILAAYFTPPPLTWVRDDAPPSLREEVLAAHMSLGLLPLNCANEAMYPPDRIPSMLAMGHLELDEFVRRGGEQAALEVLYTAHLRTLPKATFACSQIVAHPHLLTKVPEKRAFAFINAAAGKATEMADATELLYMAGQNPPFAYLALAGRSDWEYGWRYALDQIFENWDPNGRLLYQVANAWDSTFPQPELDPEEVEVLENAIGAYSPSFSNVATLSTCLLKEAEDWLPDLFDDFEHRMDSLSHPGIEERFRALQENPNLQGWLDGAVFELCHGQDILREYAKSQIGRWTGDPQALAAFFEHLQERRPHEPGLSNWALTVYAVVSEALAALPITEDTLALWETLNSALPPVMVQGYTLSEVFGRGPYALSYPELMNVSLASQLAGAPAPKVWLAENLLLSMGENPRGFIVAVDGLLAAPRGTSAELVLAATEIMRPVQRPGLEQDTPRALAGTRKTSQVKQNKK